MKYRQDIDGLRAISVLSVVFFHLKFNFFNGGYIGVDIFFFISGFLIGKKIFENLENKSFSILEFYFKRAKRILPALIMVLLITNIFSYIFFSPNLINDTSKASLSSIFFLSNIFFWSKSGYFETGTENNPLYHTWSLSVEEQFYIFFPLLMIFLYKKYNEHLLKFIFFLFSLFFLASHYFASFHPSANFYLLPFRLFEFFGGAMIGLLSLKINNRYSVLKNNFFSFFGLSLILISIFLFNEETLFPSYYSAIPLFGFSLIIFFSTSNTLVYQILSTNILRYTGIISFSIYLLHVPIINFYNLNFGVSNFFDYFYILLILFLLSYLLYYFIENRFRKLSLKNFLTLKKYLIILLPILFILNFGVYFFYKDIKNFYIKNLNDSDKKIYHQTLEAQSHSSYNKMINKNCKVWSRNLSDEFKKKFNECANSSNKKIILMIGDSHQMDLYNAFSSYSTYPNIFSISRGRCRVHTPKPLGYDGCEFEEQLKFINDNKDFIQAVIYHQSGNFLLKGRKNKTVNYKKINLIIDYLKKIDSNNVIWIGPRLEPNILIDFTYTKRYENYSNNVNFNIKYVDDFIENILLKSRSIKYISLEKLINFDLNRDFYNNNFLFSDFDHWSEFGEKYFGNKIIKNSKYLYDLLNS